MHGTYENNLIFYQVDIRIMINCSEEKLDEK